MSKKNRFAFDEYDDEEDLVIDKKTKRRMERAAREQERQQREAEKKRLEEENPEDRACNEWMSQIATYCQEHRWREALLAGRKAVLAAAESGQEMPPIPMPLLTKLDKSMRRQMAAKFIAMSRELLDLDKVISKELSDKEVLPHAGE